jgi:hypothetical protein
MICILAAVAIAAHPPADTAKKTDYSAPPGAPYTAENVTVPTKAGHTLAGTLTLPKGASRTHPVSAIVTITGTGPQERDEFLGLAGYRPFRQIADSLGRRGIAVLRMDDRGVGASKGTFKGATDEDFANDIRAGLAYLRTRPEIDATRLGLLGHSEGALIAAMVAPREPNLRAVVMLAGASGSLRQIAIDQLSNQITHDPKLSAAQKDSALRHAPAVIDSMGIDPWWHFLMTHDFSIDERQVKKPAVLILTGGNDQQANPKQVAEMAANVKTAGNRDVTAEVIPGVDHLFIVDPDGYPGHYKDLPTPAQVEPKVIGIVVDWLAVRLGGQ